MPNAFARVKRSATRSSALQFAAHSGRALAAGGEESVVHDHDMDVLVAATRIELGSRCLATGDYEGGVVAFTAVLQHDPLGARAAEAQRGLVQCQKGLKLESLGALQTDDSDAAVNATLKHLGVPQWHSAPPSPSTGSSPSVRLPEPEPEPELELPQPPELDSELLIHARLDRALTARSSLLSQVERLQGTVQHLEAELVKKSVELDAMRQTAAVASNTVAEQARRESEVTSPSAIYERKTGALGS